MSTSRTDPDDGAVLANVEWLLDGLILTRDAFVRDTASSCVPKCGGGRAEAVRVARLQGQRDAYQDVLRALRGTVPAARHLAELGVTRPTDERPPSPAELSA